MKISVNTRTFFVLLASLFLTTSVSADLTLRYQSGSDFSVIKVSNGKARLASGEMGNALVFNSLSGDLLALDETRKQYVDVAQMMEQVGGMQNQLSEMMSEALQGRSAEEQEAMKNMMSGLMGSLTGNAPEAAPSKPSIDKSGNMETVNGYQCERVVVTDGAEKMEYCVIKPGALDVSNDDYSVMQQLMQRMQSIGEKARQFMNNGGPVMMPEDLGGIPIKFYGENAGELVSVNHEPLNEDEFNVPENYQKTKIPGL